MTIRSIRCACFGFLAALALQTPGPFIFAGEQVVGGRSFTLPPGFQVELIAGPPLVDRPITADFDEQGRLYVADSSGSNDKVADQLVRKPHRILRLEDTDGDGRFDRRTVFADRMMFPEGTLWYDGSLYVAAPPSLWKLTDTDNDGVADQRVEWHQGKTLTGCANDLHGPYLGPDGWIYWCKGAFARQVFERPGKAPLASRASHLLRARPDGSNLEIVMTGGMDNPVDVAFTPGGEPIVSCTFLQQPGGGRRDGLIHAVYGGLFGKVHDVLDGQIRTGAEVMPILSHLGPAAPCGLTSYESAAFGPEFQDNLFACQFNLRKVSRHILTPDGATFRSRDEDFLVSPDHDFHPTDVLEDADGSLVVIDTGGWYKLCCPTSQLPKPDVLGAIYRVRKVDAVKVDDPRGLKLAWFTMTPADLTALLDDPRPAVRRRAIHQLGKAGETAVKAISRVLKTNPSAEARRNAVWAATRIDSLEARAAVREALADADPIVRQVACQSAGLWRDHDASKALLRIVADRASPPARRAAAEALGRSGDLTAVNVLLTAAAGPIDRFLEHSLTFALIEIDEPVTTALRLSTGSPGPGARRAALMALEQTDRSRVSSDAVVPGLASTDPAVRETSTWIAERHPEWAEAIAADFRERLAARPDTPSDREETTVQLARFASLPAVQSVIVATLRDPAAPRAIALRAMARSGLKTVPKTWLEELAALLNQHESAAITAETVSTARALSLKTGEAPELAAALRTVGNDAALSDAVRLDALAAIPGGPGTLSPDLFGFLVGRLDPEKPVVERTTAAELLGRARLSGEQLVRLTDLLKSAGPLEIDRLLSAFETSSDEALGIKLLETLKVSAARRSVRPERLGPLLARFGPRVRDEAGAFLSSLNVDASAQKARLDAILPTIAGGDVRRGQAVFNGAKAGCLTCHAVGYVGGTVGPDLTRIGETRTERDLLESVLYPSLSFVRSYEPMTVSTRDGRVISGILKGDSASEVVLAVNATEVARLPRDQVEEIRPGTTSVMPAGLDQQLTQRELADLIVFLKSRK